MLTIKKGMQIPPDAVMATAFDDLPSALAWISHNAQNQHCSLLSRVQEIAEEFPLLAGASLEYWELREPDLLASGLSDRDQAELKACFMSNPAGILVYPEPKLIVCPALMPPSDVDRIIRHELVHLEQNVRGDSVLVADAQIWKGERYYNDRLMDINAALSKKEPSASYAYLSLPWEREAIARTEGEEAYLFKLRMAHFTLHITQHLPVSSRSKASDLAYQLTQILFGCEDRAKLEGARVSASGAMIASVLTDGHLSVSGALGEFILTLAGVVLKTDLDSVELVTADHAWSLLIKVAFALEEQYPRESNEAAALA